MKHAVLFTALGLAAAAAQAQQYPYQPPYQTQAAQPVPAPAPQYQQPVYQSAPASETARVISSTPVIQQVAVPRQVCSQQPVVVEGPRTSGAGSVIGAIAGGLLGNTIGHGGGRAAATALGVMGGALVGNSVEAQGSPGYVQNAQACTTQTTYENRTVAYNVTYEYNGQQYTVQMPQDPGPTLRLQVSPVGAAGAPPVEYASPAPVYQPVYQDVPQAFIINQQPVVVPGTVVYPAAYYRPYYPPVGISLNLGYSRGYYGHRHWR